MMTTATNDDEYHDDSVCDDVETMRMMMVLMMMVMKMMMMMINFFPLLVFVLVTFVVVVIVLMVDVDDDFCLTLNLHQQAALRVVNFGLTLSGHKVKYNPPGDGNCGPASAARALGFRVKALRQSVHDYMTKHETLFDALRLRTDNLADHISIMAKDAVYWSPVELLACSLLYKHDFALIDHETEQPETLRAHFSQLFPGQFEKQLNHVSQCVWPCSYIGMLMAQAPAAQVGAW